MNLLLPCIATLAIVGIKKNINIADSLNKTQTSCINGIFVILIFIRHFFQYITALTSLDNITVRINGYLGQLIVVSFMFFSGYAFVKQVALKGDAYLRKTPQKILALWIIYIITVLAFIMLGLVKGQQFDVQTILLALIGMKSVGNSTWYIFAIICCWFFSYIALRQKRLNSILILSLLILLYIILISRIKDVVFYNTVIAYAIGFAFAHYEDKVYPVLQKLYCVFLLISIVLLLVGISFHTYFIVDEIWVLAFCVFLVLFSMKLQLNNRLLNWLSQYSLEIYLIQRIPMMILQDKISINILYFLCAWVLTLGLAFLWKKMFQFISKLCLRTKAKA